jgi:single-stranded-DNA-specific exonuclease
MKSYRVRKREHEELLLDLLSARGVIGQEAQARFLSPEYERDSHDPFLLPDMDAAVERILSALKNNEQIAVWSDYDSDGIPGGVMLTDFLRTIGLSVRHYIPDRHKEGYGLNETGIEELMLQGVTLIITVDLGTTEGEAIAFAKQKGIDVIVTDHHLVHEIPNAHAVINPKRPDSVYPFDGLCGAGVAWKLVQAILSKKRPDGFGDGQEKWYLDLVGLATLSDMVPLVGENRMLARFGLMVLRKNRRPGLAQLLSLLRIKPATLTEDDIGFMISPRLNAASRMDSPEIAARLLATKDYGEALELAQKLDGINNERKGLVASIVKEVNKRLAAQAGLTSQEQQSGGVIVMGSPSWRPGVLGLVANKIVENHGGVAFVWGREGGELLRGSCRTDGTINIVDLMTRASDAFDHFGGHAASGGFAVQPEKVHELEGRLQKAFEEMKSTATKAPETILDRELELAEVPRAHKTIQTLSPFGIENSKPLFLLPNVSIASVRTFGKAKDHLELTCEREGATVSGVSFFSTPDSYQKKISAGSKADIVGHVELDWRGSPRLRIVDVI